MDDERVAKFQEAHGLTEEQARIELMRSGAAAMDEGWAQALAGDETNTARARDFLASELQQAGRTDLFQVSASEYADHRLNLKETFGDDEAYKSILDYLALPNEVTREEMWAASGKGSGDALREMVTPSLEGIRDRAEMGLDLVFNDGRQTWGSVKSGLEDLSYKGVEARLKIVQGDLLGAEYDVGAGASMTGVGLGAATGPGLFWRGASNKKVFGDATNVTNGPWGERVEGPANNVTKGVSNPVPGTVARVVPDNPITRASGTLGRPGAYDVFVTAADDIRGLNAKQIAERLTIPESPTGFRVIEFPTPKSGIASPVNRTDPGFIGGGRTVGGGESL